MLLETPNRRRQSQLCNVIIEKPYYERETANVNFLVDEEESNLMEDKVNDSFETHSKHDVVSVRLSNSSILENIDEKLAHLHPEQKKKQMEELIFKYKDLIADVPRRMMSSFMM